MSKTSVAKAAPKDKPQPTPPAPDPLAGLHNTHIFELANQELYHAMLALKGLGTMLVEWKPCPDDIDLEDENNSRMEVMAGVGCALQFVSDGIGDAKDLLRKLAEKAEGGAR